MPRAPDRIPRHVHSFALTKVSTAAVTYHLKPSAVARDGMPRHIGGWALATVNDATGELSIQSDWGNWSYRWNTDHMGETVDGRAAWHPPQRLPMRKVTLTEFIAHRDGAYCDYLANKLATRDCREVFDAHDTVRAMQARLIECRVEAARAAIEYYRDEPDEDRVDVLTKPPRWLESREIWCDGRKQKVAYAKETVREIYDALDELKGASSSDEFCRLFSDIDAHALITEEPWESLQFRTSHSYDQLLHGILPALVQACADRLLFLAGQPAEAKHVSAM